MWTKTETGRLFTDEVGTIALNRNTDAVPRFVIDNGVEEIPAQGYTVTATVESYVMVAEGAHPHEAMDNLQRKAIALFIDCATRPVITETFADALDLRRMARRARRHETWNRENSAP
jgi:hypothetical protein